MKKKQTVRLRKRKEKSRTKKLLKRAGTRIDRATSLTAHDQHLRKCCWSFAMVKIIRYWQRIFGETPTDTEDLMYIIKESGSTIDLVDEEEILQSTWQESSRDILRILNNISNWVEMIDVTKQDSTSPGRYKIRSLVDIMNILVFGNKTGEPLIPSIKKLEHHLNIENLEKLNAFDRIKIIKDKVHSTLNTTLFPGSDSDWLSEADVYYSSEIERLQFHYHDGHKSSLLEERHIEDLLMMNIPLYLQLMKYVTDYRGNNIFIDAHAVVLLSIKKITIWDSGTILDLIELYIHNSHGDGDIKITLNYRDWVKYLDNDVIIITFIFPKKAVPENQEIIGVLQDIVSSKRKQKVRDKIREDLLMKPKGKDEKALWEKVIKEEEDELKMELVKLLEGVSAPRTQFWFPMDRYNELISFTKVKNMLDEWGAEERTDLKELEADDISELIKVLNEQTLLLTD